jgi:hypothetical protein
MAEISVRITESYSTWIVRDNITIDTSNYPELEGMSEEEAQDYIQSNASEMSAPEGYDYCDNLYEALMEQDVVRDKISNEDTEIEFD